MKTITSLFAIAAVAATTALPSVAAAQWHPWSSHRHVEREQWRDVALAGGIVGLVGAATHNSTVAAIGLGGALYGGIRYEDEFRRGGYYDRRYDHRAWFDRGWHDRRGDDRRWERHGR